MLRTTRPLRLLALSALVAMGIVVATPVAASAHDRLVSSSPAADAVLGEVPTTITLTFNAELLSDPATVVLDVLSPSGENVAADAPSVDGVTVTRALSADIDAGQYRVLWKVVSSDAHPISGEFAYTVDAAAIAPAPVATPIATPEEEPSAAPAVSATPSATPVNVTATRSAGGDMVLALTIGTIVLVFGGIIVVLLVAVRRRGKTPPKDSGAGR